MTDYIPRRGLMDDYALASVTVEMLRERYESACRNEKDRVPEIQAMLNIAHVKQRDYSIALADEYMNQFFK